MKQKLTKKNLLIVFAVFILVALSACSGKREVATPITEPTVDVQKTVEYYVAQTQAAVIPPTATQRPKPTATQRPKPTATEEAYCPKGKTEDDARFFSGIIDEVSTISGVVMEESYLISVYIIQAEGLLNDVKSRSVTPCMERVKSLLVSSLTHFVNGLVYVEAGNSSGVIEEIGKAIVYMEMIPDEILIVKEKMTP